MISSRGKVATGINVFTVLPDRQKALLDTLGAINHEILVHKFPMNISSNFHCAIDAPVIINYNQYTDRESGQYLRTRSETAPLLKRSHELSEKHEIRWYEVSNVIAADGGYHIEISDAGGALAVIGIFTVEPGKQGEFLALLERYGQALRSAKARGFIGLAVHRGYHAAHVATYEQWASADAYRHAMQASPTAGLLTEIRETVTAGELHHYDVVAVTRFDLTS